MQQEVKKLIETLHPLERKVLPYLKDQVTVGELVTQSKLLEVEVTRALQWLGNKKILQMEKETHHTAELSMNGKIYLEKGLPERRFLQVLEDEELTLKEIQDKAALDKNELNISLGLLKKLGAITLGKELGITDYGRKLITQKLLEETFLKTLPKALDKLDGTERKLYDLLAKRKQIVETTIKKTTTVYLTTQGKQLTKSQLNLELIDTINRKTLKEQTWKGKTFRRYDVEINVPHLHGGKRHFVNQAIDYIKRIWLDLGFKEMKGPLLETSFWNFDALFQPQDHPAREMHDTFFVKGTKPTPNKELIQKIKKTHETGWTTGSTGWGYQWSEKIAKQLVLRTHTTALSVRTLAQLKQTDIPAKYFSVAKCFRNETIDWKHSFEFNQVEGIVVDENTTFRHLLGYLKEYYHKLGFDKIRFRPAYFPYTEMSVESEYYNPTKKEWVEFGGAGMFRPEVTKPLLGHDTPVLAWGQGMERAIMDYYNIKDLRDLYNNDLKQLKEIKMWMK
tara:strand:+ start:21741 stop:23258 length:1518 start_codon:yes stop_codon:yes gene_type:complete